MSRPIPVDKTKAGSTETSASDYTSVVRGSAIISAAAAQPTSGTSKPRVSIPSAVASSAKSAVFANPVVSAAAKTFYATVQSLAAYIPPEWRYKLVYTTSGFLIKQVGGSRDGKTLYFFHSSANSMYKSTDYGETWSTSISVPIRPDYVSCSDDGTKITIGITSGSINISDNSGTSWTDVTPPIFTAARAWRALTASRDGMKIAVIEGNGGYVYTTEDRGANWTQRTAPGGRTWTGITGTRDGNILYAYIAGQNIWKSTNSGVDWTELTGTGNSKNWGKIVCSNDGNILLATIGSATTTMFRSIDGGASWSATAPSTIWLGNGISENGTIAFAVTNGGGTNISFNGGSTWTSTSMPNGQWGAMFVSGDGTTILANLFAARQLYTARFS